MANVSIPKEFKQIISSNQEIEGILLKTLSDFGDILKENKMYFFEEYTDHGIDHIEAILHGTSNILDKNSINEYLDADNLSSYVFAVLLHDLGMHLNYEGFKFLIDGGNDKFLLEESKLNKQLDKFKWSELWEDFISNAKKYNGEQLEKIFGDDEIIVRDPLLIPKNKMTSADKKLIGEFIRINHPRIAHEIALFGFPGANQEKIEFANGIESSKRDLIGFIARSHGLNLREALKIIENEFDRNKRAPFGIHSVYLMVLLRIADYFQIDNSRTSKITIRLRKFDSPISEFEHNSHLSIISIDDQFQDDPESIFVQTDPSDSILYLKLKKLFYSIQKELDISWAVLGELYGKSKVKPKIKFRRIQSNLDTPNYIKSQKYVGDSFYFNANNELIKLLIAPLYGDDPKYGVRELMQNSIDACLEREQIEEAKFKPRVDIKVFKDKDKFYFLISDNGKGMSIEEIKGYFLSAGASYRKSRDWKEKFESHDGKSKVQRNGRFGIGVLAAFLIGNQIEVKTKSIKSSLGYSFKTHLQTSQIEVYKDDDLSIGTSVKIEISEENYDYFQYAERKDEYTDILWSEWYRLKKPEINYFLDGKKINEPKYFDPHYTDIDIPSYWHKIDYPGYNKIL